jgi:hypothetical protein
VVEEFASLIKSYRCSKVYGYRYGVRGRVDHAPAAHDDIANAVAGALVTDYKEPQVKNLLGRFTISRLGLCEQRKRKPPDWRRTLPKASRRAQ